MSDTAAQYLLQFSARTNHINSDSIYYNSLKTFSGVANYINADTSREDSASKEHSDDSDDKDDKVSDNSDDDEVKEETTVPGEGLFGSARKLFGIPNSIGICVHL
jgi:hypothetical protein